MIPQFLVNPTTAPDTELCCHCDREEIERLWWEEEQRLMDSIDPGGDFSEDDCEKIKEAEEEFRERFGECGGCLEDRKADWKE